MKAVLFGAGSIGRGFIAELLTEAGIDVVFVDVNKNLVEAINRQGSYRQVIVGDEVKEKTIKNVRAVDGSDTVRVSEEVCDCGLLSTSVGAGVLSIIAPVIASGLTKRWERGNENPLNILICENLNRADYYLKKEIKSHLSEIDHKKLDMLVGFLETSIGRMIPVIPEDIAKKDPTTVYVEPYRFLPYDIAAVKGVMPDIPAMVPFSPFEFYMERKLFVHNMGHFLSALLGRLKGQTYVWEAMGEPAIAYFVRSAMGHTALALSKKHGVEYAELSEHVDDLLYRFQNKALGDTIERVSRDIPRKLAPDDRLLGALDLCREQNVPTEYVQLGLAAAYHLTGDMDTPEHSELVSTLQSAMKTGFDFNVIQEIIQYHQFAGGKMVV